METTMMKKLLRWVLPFGLSIGALVLGQYVRLSAPKHASYVTDVQANQLREIQVSGNGVSLILINRSGQWEIDGEPQKKIDQTAVQEWIERVRSVSVDRDATGVSGADSGLDHPRFAVRWLEMSGAKGEIAIGVTAPSGEIYLKHGQSVGLVSAIQSALVRVDEGMLRDRQPFQTWAFQDVIRWRADTPTARYQAIKMPVTGWWWILPQAGRPYLADPVAVDRYFQLVRAARFQSFQTAQPTGKPWQITFETPTQSMVVACRAFPDASTGIQDPSGEWGIVAPSFRLAGLGFETWRPGAKPIRFDRFRLNTLTLGVSTRTIHLFRNEAGHWMSGASMPPQTTLIHNLFSGLAELSVTNNTTRLRPSESFRLAVTTESGTESFVLARLDRSHVTITPQDGAFKAQTVTLYGDVDRVWRAVDKLTI